MFLAQCATSLLHGSDLRHAASSVIDANGDGMRPRGKQAGGFDAQPNNPVQQQHRVLPQGTQDSTTPIVYIIGGQSQATGKALTYRLTQDERDRAAALGGRVVVEVPDIKVHKEEDLAELEDLWNKELQIDNERDDSHVRSPGRKNDDPRLVPSSSTLGEVASGSAGCTFGPEVGFGLRMAEALPSRNITIIKVTCPGADIDTYHKHVYPTVLSSLRRFGEDNSEFELGGMLWLQGEADSGYNREPDFYHTNRTVRSAAPRTPAAKPLPRCPAPTPRFPPRSIPMPQNTASSWRA